MGKLQKRKLYLLIASLQAVMIAFLVLLASTAAPVSAAAGINSQLSFEGKIVHSDGTNITNGTYNMEFKIYQDGTNTGSGSTLKWTEDYLVAGSTGVPSTGGVTLTDGTFHVNLASICAFAGGSCGAKTNTAIDWNQDTLWLSVQVGNSSSCTVTSGVTSFNTGCAGDGEMSPFIRLTSVPYANVAQSANTLGGTLAAGNFVQLAQGLQADGSTSNASIAINKTGSTANILTLQKSGNSVMLIDNNGLITLQPAANLSAGQAALSQALTNASSTGGTVNGYNQTITVSNTSSASTTNGVNISLTDNTSIFGNNNNGLNISVGGSNPNTTGATYKGINISVTSGIGVDSTAATGLRGVSNSVSTAYCGINTGFQYSIGVCGDASGSGATGVYGHTTNSAGAINNDGGAGVYGNSNGIISPNQYTKGVFGQTSNTNTGTYTTIGVQGEARGGTNSTAYGGYFTYNSASAAVLGSALYASNSTIAGKILQLQDNTTDVFTVADNGVSTFKNSSNSTSAFQIQPSGSSSPLFNADTLNSRIGVNVTFTAMATPTGFAAGAPTSGGGLAFSTAYYYKITAFDSMGGETAASSEVCQAIAASGAFRQIPLSWSAVPGATGYRIYKSSVAGACGTSNAEVLEKVIDPNSTSYTDDNNYATYAVSAPSVGTAYVSSNNSTSLQQLSIGGYGTPSGQVYISGTLPTLVGVTTNGFTGFPNNIVLNGRYAYYGSDGGFKIYDISNPISPIQIGSYSLAGGGGGSGGTISIAVQGNYVYVKDQSSSRFAIVDVSKPGSPVQKSVTNTAYGTPFSIAVQGNYTYITSISAANKLMIYDTSNPTSPKYLGTNTDSNLLTNSGTAISVNGNYVYVTMNSASGKLAACNVSNPSNVSCTVNADTSLQASEVPAVIQGRYAFVTSWSFNALEVYDISGSTPTFVSFISDGHISGPTGLAISGRYAYITNTNNGKISVYDISNPYKLVYVGQNADSTFDRNAFNPVIQGRYLFMEASNFSSGVQGVGIFDIGGLFTQELEAGNTLVDSLAVKSDISVAGNASFSGGLQVSSNLQTAGSLGVAGGVSVVGSTIISGGNNRLGAPAGAVTVTPTCGASCTFTYSYIVTAVNSSGGESAASNTGTTSVAANPANNAISWSAVSGATAYKVYRTVATGTGNSATTGYIGTTVSTSFTDGAVVGAGNSAPTVDTTGQLTVLGSALIKSSTNSATAFQIQDSAGSAVLAVDSTNKHLKVYGANGTDYSDIYYDSSTSTAYYGASTGTAVLGSGTGAVNVTAGAGSPFVVTGNAASTIQTTVGAVGVQGAGGINLTSTGTNGTTVKSTGAATTAFQIQNSSNVTGLAYDATTFHLKIYENIASPVRFADIYYDNATGTAIFAASSGTVQIGGNTGPVTISTSGSDPVNITANGNSTWQTAAGTLTIQGATSLSLDSATTGSISIGTSAFSKTINVGGNLGSGLNQQVFIGGMGSGSVSNVTVGPTASGVTGSTNIQSGSSGLNIATVNSPTVQIGNISGTVSQTINIGNNATASSTDTIVIGSLLGTSKTTLQGGILTTTNNNSGIVIGGGYSSSDTNLVPLTLDSTTTFTETASTCTATVNGGTLYYNSTSNAIRACVNGAWEDMVSTATLGLQLFGVVPDTGGAGAGDLSGVTGLANGPCRVSAGANLQTVAWTACVAFSGGRKVIVAAGSTATTNTIANNFQHLCLTGANNAPALSATGAETANLATVSMPSVGSPILCLADIKFTGANNTITQIYDTRTFTTTSKTFASAITTAPVLGQVVKAGTVTPGAVTATTVVAETKTVGVIVATTGATSTTTVNAIVAVNGPAAAKAITGTNTVGEFVTPSATAGYAVTSATFTSTAGYGLLGTARTAWTGATACSINANTCAGSIQVDLRIR